MNSQEIRQLIDCTPTYSRYVALFIDAERGLPYWYTARNDEPLPLKTYLLICQELGAAEFGFTKDGTWLFIDVEQGTGKPLPMSEAYKIMCDFHKEYEKDKDPFDLMANALAAVKKRYGIT